MSKNKFHCKDMFVALDSANASKDVKNLVKIFGWDENLVEIFNKLKHSNKFWITQEEYNQFDDFLAMQDDLYADLEQYLESHYLLDKKRNFWDISKNLYLTLLIMLDQARIIWILQSQTQMTFENKTYEFQKFHQEPVEFLAQKNEQKIFQWLRTRKYFLFDGEKEILKTSEKIFFAEHSTLEQFGTLLETQDNFLLIHNQKTLKISKNSEFVVTRTGGLFIIDQEHNIFYNFDIIHSQCTQQSFTGTSIIQTFKSLNISLLEDSSIPIEWEWTIANVKLYDYEKNQILLQYLHPQFFKLEKKKFYAISYDLKAFHIYDWSKIISYNQRELDELRLVPEFFRQFRTTKKEA